jgi:ABC-2 type transport system permease protein
MVGVFVRLKLRILRRRLGSAGLFSAIGFVLVWLAGVTGGLSGMVLLGLVPRYVPEARVALIVVVYSVIAFAWVVGPVVAASVDDTLDIRRFELLPIPRGRLAVGLVAAALVGPGGAATAIAVVGGSVAGYADVSSVVPILAASVTLVALVVVTARLLLTWLSDLLRSRRTREIAGLALGLTLALPGVVSIAASGGQVRLEGPLDEVVGPLVWFPPGATASAVVSFADHNWSVGLRGLAYGLAALAVVTWAYGRALDRLQTRSETAAVGRRVRGTAQLRPLWLSLPAGPVGGVAAKELKYLRRDPRLRAQLTGSAIGLLLMAGVGLTAVDPGDYGPFFTLVVAFLLVAALVVNQFGHDGGCMWMYLVMAPNLVTVLKGKNLAWVVFIVPLVTAAGVLGAVMGGSALYLGPAVIAAETNPFGSKSASGASVVASLVGLLVAGLLSLPVLAGVGLPAVFLGAAWATAGAALALAYGAGVYWFSLARVAGVAQARAFSLLEVIDGE